MNRHYEALATKCRQLEAENATLKAANVTMEAEKRQWLADKARWEGMIAGNLASSDGQKSDLEAEVIRLRGKLKEAGINPEG